MARGEQAAAQALAWLGIFEGEGTAQAWVRRSRVEALGAVLKAGGGQGPALAKRLQAAEKGRQAANARYVEARLRQAPKDPVLKALNPAQARAAVSAEDTNLVLAGAGTGKTRTMVHTVLDGIVRERMAPGEIAFVTFTRKAGGEIRERMVHALKDGAKAMTIGTIHALARQLIGQATGSEPRVGPEAEPGQKRQALMKRLLADVLEANPTLWDAVRLRGIARTAPEAGDWREGWEPNGEQGPVEHGVAAAVQWACEGKGWDWAARPLSGGHQSPYRSGTDYVPAACVHCKGGAKVWVEAALSDGRGRFPRAWSRSRQERAQKEQAWRVERLQAVGDVFVQVGVDQVLEGAEGSKALGDALEETIVRSGLEPAQSPVRREWRNPLGTDPAGRVAGECDQWIQSCQQAGLGEEEIEAARTAAKADPEVAALAALGEAVRAPYLRWLAKDGGTDHNETIRRATEAVERGQAAPPWRLVIVDEWQDVNPAQAKLIRTIAGAKGPGGERPRVHVVGDDWQSIYAFQGGDVRLTKAFAESGDACTTTVLDRSYRFGDGIAQGTKAWALGDRDAIDKPVQGRAGAWRDRLGTAVEVCGRRVRSEHVETYGEEKGAAPAVRAVLDVIGHHKGTKDSPRPPTVMVLSRLRETTGDVRRSEGEEVETVLRQWMGGAGRLPKRLEGAPREKVQEQAEREAQRRIARGLPHAALAAYAEERNLSLDFAKSTVHGAKGLEADYVIFVQGRSGLNGGGDRALERGLSVLRGRETHREEEERRVWYVALTRARRRVYVIAPPEDVGDTVLLDELWRNADHAYGVGESELAGLLVPYRPAQSCPECFARGVRDAKLVAREGRTGNWFVGCTSFGYEGSAPCGHRERCCWLCGEGVMRRDETKCVCTREECRAEIEFCGCDPAKPLGLVRPKVGTPFFACQNGREDGCGRRRPPTPKEAGRLGL